MPLELIEKIFFLLMVFYDVSTSMSNVNLWVQDFSSRDNENFEWIKLSASDHRYCVGMEEKNNRFIE